MDSISFCKRFRAWVLASFTIQIQLYVRVQRKNEHTERERSYEIFIRLVRPFFYYYRLFHRCYNIKPHINYTQPTFFIQCFVYLFFLLIIRWLFFFFFFSERCLFHCLVLWHSCVAIVLFLTSTTYNDVHV